MTRTPNTSLLEHYASQHWFARHGEVALTTGLGFCLNQDPGASAAVVEFLNACAGTALATPEEWHPEYRNEDLSRPDLVGVIDVAGVKVQGLLVEAKLSAAFAPGQLTDYASRQHEQVTNAGATEAILVIVVPDWRKKESASRATADLGLGVSPLQGGVGIPDAPEITLVVVSWQELIEAAAEGADGERVRFHGWPSTI